MTRASNKRQVAILPEYTWNTHVILFFLREIRQTVRKPGPLYFEHCLMPAVGNSQASLFLLCSLILSQSEMATDDAHTYGHRLLNIKLCVLKKRPMQGYFHQ